jgi:hypothetical protein
VTSGVLQHSPPEQLVELVTPYLWTYIVEGIPANTCVDGCLTLRYAYGQFGIRAEPQPVSLVVCDEHGQELVATTKEPSWSADGRVFHGHCVLALPNSQRLVDATVEQFAPVRELAQGPLVGRTVYANPPAPVGQLMAPGAMFGVQRGSLQLIYTVAAEEYSSIVDDQQWVTDLADQHYRTGVNLASLVLLAQRDESVIGRALQAPYPRLRALLRAIGDAPEETDDVGDVRFQLAVDGETKSLRLDEIPLPPTTPAPYPRTTPSV